MRSFLFALLFVGTASLAAGPPYLGVPWASATDPNTGVSWNVCFDYEPARNGDGCFIQFLSNSKSGALMAGVTLHGGLVDATAGKEQGDLDIGLMIDGKYGTVISFTGSGVGLPGIQTSRDGYFNIGAPYAHFKAIYLSAVPCPVGVPGKPINCINVNGGFVPIYQ